MYSDEGKPLVLTIHGIRTRVEWQERSASLLKPFYRPRIFKYNEYGHPVLSVAWLGLQLLGGAVGLLLAATLLIAWRPFANWLDWLFAVLVFLSFWLGSGLLASKRLDDVAEKFAVFWGETVAFRSAPHVVAHSLGTFLTGTCLAKYQGLRASRLILNGCVLHRDFRWGTLRSAHRVREVCNEIARKDWVSLLAYVLHGLVPRMGHSGVFGFHDPPHTKTWDDPHRLHSDCEDECTCGATAIASRQQSTAFVHNIVHPELGHSDVHLGPAHAIAFRLPALWGIPSLPYVQFRELCIECQAAEKNHAMNESELEAKLRTSCWGWTKGPLEKKVIGHIKSRLKTLRKSADISEEDLGKLVSLSVRNLWTAVAIAVEKYDDEKWAVNLNPELALTNAVEASLEVAGVLGTGQTIASKEAV